MHIKEILYQISIYYQKLENLGSFHKSIIKLNQIYFLNFSTIIYLEFMYFLSNFIHNK